MNSHPLQQFFFLWNHKKEKVVRSIIILKSYESGYPHVHMILFFFDKWISSLKVQGVQPKYIGSIQEKNTQQNKNEKREYKNLQS